MTTDEQRRKVGLLGKTMTISVVRVLQDSVALCVDGNYIKVEEWQFRRLKQIGVPEFQPVDYAHAELMT